MTNVQCNEDQVTRWLCWLARGLGLLLLLIVLVTYVGEVVGGRGAARQAPVTVPVTLKEILLSAALVATLAGVVVGWRWEGIGGAVAVSGTLLFLGINSLASGYFRITLLEPALALVGFLFLVCWWRKRTTSA